MGKLETFDIEFDNPTGVFYAGDILRGRVHITLDEPMTMRAVRIRLTGRARTSWPDEGFQLGPGGVTERVFCVAEDVYFDVHLTLYGHPPGRLGGSQRRQTTLSDGSHTLPFRFNIPTHCPTSFEGEFGSIRYLCRAYIDKPWKFDHAAKRAFTFDLNLQSVSGEPDPTRPGDPLDNEQTQTVTAKCCFGCFGAGPGEIRVKVALPRCGFVPGEHIPVWANIVNNCGRKLKKVRAVLLQRARYKSKFRGSVRERTSYRKVAEVFTKENLQARWALVWDQQYIHVPPLPPPIDQCALIHVDYGLVFEVADMSIALPICIGTIPLRSSFPSLRNQCETDFIDRADVNRLPVDLLPLPLELDKYPGMPPPCYGTDQFGEVSIRERTDTEYVRGQLEFGPRYPYYSWPPKEFSFTEDVDKLSLSVFLS